MVIHNCPLCNKEFTKKSTYDYHINNKKTPCVGKNVYMITTNNENSTQTPHKSTQNPHKLHTNPHNLQDGNLNNITESQNLKDIKSYKCPYCDLVCARSDSLNRHIEKYCKNKDHFDKINLIQSKLNELDNNDKYKKLEEDNKKLIELLEEYKVFIKENNLIKQSIPSMNNSNLATNANNTNNSNNIGDINNGAINNGTVNNNNTTINNIVQFGKEDLSKCNIIEMMNIYLKSTGGNIFPNILKYLNFNPKFPENFNIVMSDFSRENVKIHDGTKFVTKKFKNVKDDILNSLSNHITTMCDTYVENPKAKKSEDILGKIKINNISVKLINNDDITPLLTIKKEKKKKEKKENENDDEYDDEKSNQSNQSDESEEYLDLEGEKKLVHFENKRQSLQEITTQKLKDELYNNKSLIEKHHKLIET